jgi:hypothetical protein
MVIDRNQPVSKTLRKDGTIVIYAKYANTPNNSWQTSISYGPKIQVQKKLLPPAGL